MDNIHIRNIKLYVNIPKHNKQRKMEEQGQYQKPAAVAHKDTNQEGGREAKIGRESIKQNNRALVHKHLKMEETKNNFEKLSNLGRQEVRRYNGRAKVLHHRKEI